MLLIHTALHAEAIALIQHFGLKREHNEPVFACFSAKNICLVESGIGKINAAAAVAWLSGRLSVDNPVWLNIGIAGHATLQVGSLVRAQSIEDAATGKRWYPADMVAQGAADENLISIDRETADYADDHMMDMEASGFISAANRFTALELVQSLKIISDNHQNPARRYKAREIVTLISPHLPAITHVADQLCQLRKTVTDEGKKEHAEAM